MNISVKQKNLVTEQTGKFAAVSGRRHTTNDFFNYFIRYFLARRGQVMVKSSACNNRFALIQSHLAKSAYRSFVHIASTLSILTEADSASPIPHRVPWQCARTHRFLYKIFNCSHLNAVSNFKPFKSDSVTGPIDKPKLRKTESIFCGK
jgi:hypothetical protein